MRRLRFGSFEIDLRSRELRKSGIRIKLENQPFEILLALIQQPGQLVTRAELQARIWPDGTYVDFDKSLTKAINKLRTALSDSAARPQFIETLSRRGYRFIAQVETVESDCTESAAEASVLDSHPGRRWLWVAIAALAAILITTITVSSAKHTSWLPTSADTPVVESIVVLPVANLTGDAQRDYFADGLTDQIISNLARFATLRVISRTSAMHLKLSQKALPEIARELHMEGVVEGSVHLDQNRLKVNIRLIHAPTDRQLWANTFEGDTLTAQTLQRQITVAIAHEIGARRTAEDMARILGRRLRNPAAYDAYLRGRALWNHRHGGAISQAAEHFHIALQIDNEFALAYSGLADCYSIGWSAATNYELAEEYARRALALEPQLAEAHVSLAMSLLCQYKYDDVERLLTRGIELNSNYVTGHQFYTIYLLTMGRLLDALAQSDRALQLDPYSLPVNNMRGYVLVGLRRYSQALEHLRTPQDIAPTFLGPYEQTARIHWLQNHAAEALAIERRMADITQNEQWRAWQIEAEAALTTSGSAAACWKSADAKLRFYEKFGTISQFAPILQFATARDEKKVLSLLEDLLSKRGYAVAMMLKTAPEFDFLRGNPRFQSLLRQTGIPPP